MNPELKEKWITALKSGKYQQGQHVLRNKNNEFCCLGVLCDIINPNGWKVEGYRHKFFFGKDVCHTSLSQDILKVVGLDGKEEGELIHLNDGDKVSFSKIAGHIEKYL